MVSKHSILILLALVVALFFAVAQGGLTQGADAPATSIPLAAVELASDVQKAIGVRVEPVHEQVLGAGLAVNGRIEAIAGSTAQINAPLAGRVLRLLSMRGKSVRKGQDLVLLDSPEIRQLTVEAERSRAQAQAQLAQARARLELTRQTYEREKELVNLKISARKDFLVADADLRSAGAELEAARSQLALGGAQLANRLAQLGQNGARAQSNGTVALYSPIAGTVAEQQVTAGEAVETGRTLFRVVDARRVWATAEVYEKDLARVRPGLPVAVSTQAYPRETFRGRIDSLDPTIGPETRTLGVRAVLDNPGGRLRPGMFATLRLAIDAGSLSALAVPRSAVLESGGRQIVFVQTGRDSFAPVEVTLGRPAGEFVEVKSGLSPSQRVVVAGAFQVQAQMLKGTNPSADDDAPRPAQDKPGQAALSGMPPVWAWIAGTGVLCLMAFGAGVFATGQVGRAKQSTRNGPADAAPRSRN